MGCSAGLPSISSKEISLGPWRPEEHWVECYYEGREEEYEESKNAALTFWAFVMNVILVLVSRAGYGWGLNSLAIVANKSNNNINETTQQRAMRRGTTNSNNNNQDEPTDAGMRPSNFDWLTVENGAWTQGLLSWPGLEMKYRRARPVHFWTSPLCFIVFEPSRHTHEVLAFQSWFMWRTLEWTSYLLILYLRWGPLRLNPVFWLNIRKRIEIPRRSGNK